MERAKRIAENESRFRDINERLRRDMRAAGVGPDEAIPFVCECGHQDCRDAVSLTVAEYEAVRGDGRRFAIVPGHELPEVEIVVERHGGYAVTQKTQGVEHARARDPRRSAPDD